jgi:2-methylcitrate dehydratase PrpD
MEKVSIRATDTVADDDPVFAASDRVELVLADGRTLSSPDIRFARGHWSLPLDRDQLWAKFRDCAAGRLGEDAARALFDALQSLDRLPNLGALGAEPAMAA